MRHRVKKPRLNVNNDHKAALIRNLVTSVILHEKVKTTNKKAKICVPIVERLISVAKKKDSMNAIREINKIVFDRNAGKKLLEELKNRYENRDSGFVRVVKLGNRNGDNAPLSLIELI